MIGFLQYRRLLAILLSFVFFGCHQSKPPDPPNQSKETIVHLPDHAIPFYFDSFVFLDIQVNDSMTGCFIFDSGSDQLYLDITFIAQNNIPLVVGRRKKIRGVGGNQPEVPLLDNIQLGLDSLTKVYNNVPVVDIRSITNKEVDGIFGTDLFSEYAVKINFDSSYLQIINPTSFIAPPGYDSLKLHIIENKTIIWSTATISDSVSVSGWTILDLGSSEALTITSTMADENKFDETIKAKYSYTLDKAGFGGQSHSWYFRAKNYQIGKLVLDHPVMNYSTDDKGALSFWGLLGLVGTKVMKKFNIVFDFPNKKLYLKKNTLFDEPLHSNMTGIYGKLSFSDTCSGYVVKAVIKDSPGQKAGIISGDIITHSNGLKMIYYSDIERRSLFQQDSIRLNFNIRRGDSSYKTTLAPKEIL